MKNVFIPLALLACANVGLMALTGCESSSTSAKSLSGSMDTQRPGDPLPPGYVRNTLMFPTGARESSQVTLDRISPASVTVGQNYESTLIATNITNNTLHDVTVVDTCSTNFKLDSATPAANSGKDGSLSWSLGTLGPGEYKTIVVHGSATATTDVRNCMNVSFTPAACVVTAVVEPKLTLSAVATGDTLKCQPIVIKYTVGNPGTGAAQNVMLQDSLPAGLLTEDGKNTIVADMGAIEAGQSKSIELNVRADKTGKYTHTATASGAGGLKAEAATTTVVREPILSIKQTGPASLYIDRTGTYTITVSNTGDGDAPNAMLANALPPGLKLLTAEGATAVPGKIQWDLGTLKAGDSKTFSYTLQAGGPGNFTNNATLSAQCGEQVYAPVSTEVRGIPAILLEMVDLEDPIEVGKNVTYMITVTNQGSAKDSDIAVDCALEDTMQFVSSTGSTKGTNDGLKVHFDKLPELGPKEKAVWYVTVKAIKEGDVRFTTTLNSDQLKRDVMKTESTHFYK